MSKVDRERTRKKRRQFRRKESCRKRRAIRPVYWQTPRYDMKKILETRKKEMEKRRDEMSRKVVQK